MFFLIDYFYRDVLGYLQGHPAEASPPAATVSSPSTAADVPSTYQTAFQDIPLTNMRQTIAKRLTMSKTTIPHAYVRSTATLDRVMELRQILKSRAGLKLSVNDIIIKACALGLRFVPELNATSDAATDSLALQYAVDICMAVATPAGLITPIIRGADRMPVSQIASTASSLARKARDGKLQPHEFQGGSFTISNLGMFGIREFTAIINPPQVAILAVGSGLPKAVDTMPDRPSSVQFKNTLILTLSIDSRHVTEATAGRFLTHVARLLSDHPELLLSDDPTIQRLLTGGTIAPDQFDTLLLSSAVGNLGPISKTV